MRYLLSFLLCSPVLAASVQTPQFSLAERPQGLHWLHQDGSGASADADNQADQSHWWVRSPEFKAQVSASGLLFVPFLGSQAERNWPLRMSLAGVIVDGNALEVLPPAAIERTDARLVQPRGPIVERWDFEVSSVEQSFRIDGPYVGELRVAVNVATDLRAVQLERGLRFEGPDGGVQLSGAFAIDAAGRKVALESEWNGSQLVHVVPAEFIDEVAWPLVVDPVISSFGIDMFGTNLTEPSSAYCPVSDSFLVVYQDAFSAVDDDIYSSHIRMDGTPISEGYLELSVQRWRSPDVACASAEGQFLMVAEEGTAPNTALRGVTYDAGSSTASAPFLIEAAPASRPRVGGDLLDRFLVVFSSGSSGDDVQGRLVFSNGTIGNLIDLAVGSDVDTQATVSHNNGDLDPVQASWCVAFHREAPVQDEVLAMRVSRDGVVVDPPGLVYQTVGTASNITVSSPLRQAGPQTYLLAWSRDNGVHVDLLTSIYRNGNARDSLNLSAQGLPGSSTLDDEVPVQVDSSGEGFALAWRDEFSSSSIPYVTSLDLVGDAVCIGETVELPNFGYVVFWNEMDLAPRMAPGSVDYMLTCQYFEYYSANNIVGAHYAAPSTCLGEVYCSANLNSTGFTAEIEAAGSGIAGEPLELGARRLPPGVFGYFLVSQTTGFSMPAGSQGNLCLGGTIARYQADPLNSGAFGEVATTIDTTALPFSPPVTVSSGETFHFTYWYRDFNQVPTSNFSNGVSVEFQ